MTAHIPPMPLPEGHPRAGEVETARKFAASYEQAAEERKNDGRKFCLQTAAITRANIEAIERQAAADAGYRVD